MQIDQNLVNLILKRYDLGSVVSLKTFVTGSANPVYLINGKFVLRIEEHRYESNPSKLEREEVLLKLLPKFNIPVPALIGYDNTGQIIDSPYILLEFIPGETLLESFKDLDDRQQRDVSFQLGEFAKHFHSITSEDIGHDNLFQNVDEWSKRYIKDFEAYWEVVGKTDYLSLESKEEIISTFEKYKHISKQGIGRLTHRDFSASNIQLNEGKIVGIFDFEYSCIADPLLDLQKLPLNFQLGSDFDKQEFWRGYGLIDLTEDERIRLRMHCFHQGVWEIWATETKFMPYGNKELEEGIMLILNTLSYYLLSADTH